MKLHADGFSAKPAVFSALLPILALVACAAPLGSPFGATGSQELVAVLPSAPAAWASLPDLAMSLSWRGDDGRLKVLLCEPGSRQRIAVRRGSPQAILAIPSCSGRSLMPAGALYPQCLSGAKGENGVDELTLDWEGGYAASLARALEEAGLDPWGYDLGGLAKQAVARSSDPWLLPVLEAARRLQALTFRIDGYKKPARRAVPLPGPGPWSPESPFEEAPRAEGDFCVAELSEGLWRFVGADAQLFALVDAAGGVATVLR